MRLGAPAPEVLTPSSAIGSTATVIVVLKRTTKGYHQQGRLLVLENLLREHLLFHRVLHRWRDRARLLADLQNHCINRAQTLEVRTVPLAPRPQMAGMSKSLRSHAWQHVGKPHFGRGLPAFAPHLTAEWPIPVEEEPARKSGPTEPLLALILYD